MIAPTRSQATAADVVALLRARNPLLWIVTREEARAELHLFEAAATAGYVPRTWDVGQGIADMAGAPLSSIGSRDPGETLETIANIARSGNSRGVWIMRDLPIWLDQITGATVMRQLRNLARLLPTVPRDRAQAIIVISPSGDVPRELQGHATVIDWPLPDREEITQILDAAIGSLPEEMQATAAPNGNRDAAIDAAVGLTGEEAAACYARSLVQLRKIDPTTVANEKKRVIARERVLEWFDPLPGGLDAVGGLDNLKAWLVQRRLAYTPAARAYGLEAPKGILFCGVPGTGKTYTAKAIATAWGVPLIKMDLGALKSKFVGESEANLRRAFGVIEAIGRCVILIDEIEKSLAGAIQGGADGGVSADALGSLLSWMQDRRGEAFILATANDISKLPPELLRKGRFDQIFWADLPDVIERGEIVRASLALHDRANADIHVGQVANASEGFTGAEIAALIPEALFAAFADDQREITTKDLLSAAAVTIPLAKTMADKIDALRKWAEGRATKASSSKLSPVAASAPTRALDI